MQQRNRTAPRQAAACCAAAWAPVRPLRQGARPEHQQGPSEVCAGVVARHRAIPRRRAVRFITGRQTPAAARWLRSGKQAMRCQPGATVPRGPMPRAGASGPCCARSSACRGMRGVVCGAPAAGGRGCLLTVPRGPMPDAESGLILLRARRTSAPVLPRGAPASAALDTVREVPCVLMQRCRTGAAAARCAACCSARRGRGGGDGPSNLSGEGAGDTGRGRRAAAPQDLLRREETGRCASGRGRRRASDRARGRSAAGTWAHMPQSRLPTS